VPTTYLSDLRTQLRLDLHDTDAAAYRWTDTALARHIERALAEFSAACPLTATTNINATAGIRAYSLAAIAAVHQRPASIFAVEWPFVAADPTYPAPLVRYQVLDDILYLLVADAPAAGDVIRLWYHKNHTLSESVKTLAPEDEPVIQLGAAAYAAIERESYATERITVTGANTPDDYMTWGDRALARFQALLADARRQTALAASTLHAWDTSEL